MEKESELINLGLAVRKNRIKIGLSQTELANNIGKDQPSINRLERGKINPSYLYLLEVCEGLKIHIKDLVDF